MGLRRLLVRMLDPQGGTDGQGIVIADGKFTVGDLPAGSSSLDDLTDVDVSTTPPSDGDALIFDDASSEWVPGPGGGVAEVVAGTHIDVDNTDPANPVISAYVPLTTVVDGVPDLVWDTDNNLVTTKGP